MIHNGQDAIVVDPGDATVVIEALKAKQLSLVAILVTHRHADHTHGLPALHAVFDDLPVYGPANENIVGVTHHMVEGDTFHALGLKWLVWDTPGHTSGHITFMAATQSGLPCPKGWYSVEIPCSPQGVAGFTMGHMHSWPTPCKDCLNCLHRLGFALPTNTLPLT